ncbi:MAG: hypothetical protein HQ582_00275 [Planctomycetes bacterium]|nr:hypothetical protein [Planctomycetota bacterium]
MATHTITLGIEGSGIRRTKTITNTQAGINLIDGEEVATGETDFEINFDLDVSACKSFYLESDQDVTFETNSEAAADDTIALLADEPYIWHANSYEAAFLLTTDITTSVFVTNASGATATIYCVALYDVTP